MSARVTVLGAGVIGLTCALVLAETGYSVNIIARDIPEDSTSQQFASPWAGANWHSFCTGEDERQCRWERITYRKMSALIPLGIAMKLQAFDYFSTQRPPFWFKDFSPDYRELEPSELPTAETKAGITYTTWSIDAPGYIKWLAKKLEILGVPIARATVSSIEEPFSMEVDGRSYWPTVVVNATGLGAKSLVGVEDELVLPVRGQTVLVRAPHLTKCISFQADDPALPPTYIIPRPNGDCILGGLAGMNDWDLSTDAEATKGIVTRCHALEPTLSLEGAGPETIPIIKVNVGLRPARRGGTRVEREMMQLPLPSRAFKPSGTHKPHMATGRVDVIHAYGLAGAGFQSSWGLAEDVLQLVAEAFTDQKNN